MVSTATSGPVSEALTVLSQALKDQDVFDATTSTRRFRVAMTDVGEIHFMPRLMEVCVQVAPQVRIDSVRIQGPDLPREMEAGRVDLAIGAFDEMGAGTLARMLFRQGYATLFRQAHPTAHAGMGIKAFRAERHLIVSRAAPYGQVNQSMERAGVDLAEHFSVPHFSAVPYIVSATDLLATVPEKLAASAAPPFGLRFMTPPVKVPALQTNLYWQRRVDRDSGNQWLRALIVNAFAVGA
ncbi:PCP degradation transcriptional activation protein [compost metagenome]